MEFALEHDGGDFLSGSGDYNYWGENTNFDTNFFDTNLDANDNDNLDLDIILQSSSVTGTNFLCGSGSESPVTTNSQGKRKRPDEVRARNTEAARKYRARKDEAVKRGKELEVARELAEREIQQLRAESSQWRMELDKARMELHEARKEEAVKRGKELEAARELAEREIQQLRAESSQWRIELDQARKELDEARKELHEARKEYDGAREECDKAKGERMNAENQRDEAKVERSKARDDRDVARGERDEARKDLDGAKRYEAECVTLRRNLDEVKEEHEAESTELRKELDEARRQYGEAEKLHNQLRSRLGTVETQCKRWKELAQRKANADRDFWTNLEGDTPFNGDGEDGGPIVPAE
jgi:chromosome segregation ATPase